MILKLNSRKSTASLKKINLLIYALDDREERVKIELLKNKQQVNKLIFKYEPTINRAIMLLYAEKLIIINDKGKFELTEKGDKCISNVLDEKIFKEDCIFLKKIGKAIGENSIDEVFGESNND